MLSGALQVRVEQQVQLGDRVLMRPCRRGRHEQLAVDDLVPPTVLRQILEIVERPLPLEHEHGHRILSSAPSGQVSTD